MFQALSKYATNFQMASNLKLIYKATEYENVFPIIFDPEFLLCHYQFKTASEI